VLYGKGAIQCDRAFAVFPIMIDYNRLAHNYATYRHVHPEVLRSLLEKSHLNPGLESRVLEEGCGTGNYITQIAQVTGCVCYGLDPSARMLQQATSRPTAMPVPVSYIRACAEAMGLPDAFFDLVFSVDVIHHVADRRACFREARRVLKPGGLVCTVTDSEWVIRQRVPLSSYFPATVEPELRRYPSIVTLRREMQENGFNPVREEMVEFAYDLADATPFRAKVYSALHLIDEEEFARGLSRLERDLQRGPVPCVSRYMLVWGAR
jgi:ubiquinone/menaquinone biosynthesis C-methylase UbiE